MLSILLNNYFLPVRLVIVSLSSNFCVVLSRIAVIRDTATLITQGTIERSSTQKRRSVSQRETRNFKLVAATIMGGGRRTTSRDVLYRFLLVTVGRNDANLEQRKGIGFISRNDQGIDIDLLTSTRLPFPTTDLRCVCAGYYCQVNVCTNGGTCVTSASAPFICICPDGFSGDTCNETESGKTANATINAANIVMMANIDDDPSPRYRPMQPLPLSERRRVRGDEPEPPWRRLHPVHVQVPAGLRRRPLPEQ